MILSHNYMRVSGDTYHLIKNKINDIGFKLWIFFLQKYSIRDERFYIYKFFQKKKKKVENVSFFLWVKYVSGPYKYINFTF